MGFVDATLLIQTVYLICHLLIMFRSDYSLMMLRDITRSKFIVIINDFSQHQTVEILQKLTKL